ncbi:MAG: helix-turn-helix transcriptional regulator [Acuticoccus sp.]
MSEAATPRAYCFFQDLAPRPLWSAAFRRDYLLHAVSGALTVGVGNRSWLLAPSFAAWIPGGTPFTVEIARPATSCSVLAEPGFCQRMPPRPAVFQMSPLTRHMIGHCRDWGAEGAHPAQAQTFFLALLETCADLVDGAIDVARPCASDPALQGAIAAMDAHLAQDISVAQIARLAHLSQRTLQRRFAREVGCTFSQALTRLRMIRAVALLAEGERSILAIADDCGYASLSAFNRAFVAFAGLPPATFRTGLRSE